MEKSEFNEHIAKMYGSQFQSGRLVEILLIMNEEIETLKKHWQLMPTTTVEPEEEKDGEIVDTGEPSKFVYPLFINARGGQQLTEEEERWNEELKAHLIHYVELRRNSG